MKSFNFNFWRFSVYYIKVVDFDESALEWIPAYPWYYFKLGRVINKKSRITFAWNIVPFSRALDIVFWKDKKEMERIHEKS